VSPPWKCLHFCDEDNFMNMLENIENIFRSDVAKRVGFLLTTHKLTPQLKREICKKKRLYILQHETTSILKKKEQRKKEKVEGSTADTRPKFIFSGGSRTPLRLTFKIYILVLNPKTIFKALESSFEALERSLMH
jgi:hypothetical protein